MRRSVTYGRGNEHGIITLVIRAGAGDGRSGDPGEPHESPAPSPVGGNGALAVTAALAAAVRSGRLDPDKLPRHKLYVHLSAHALHHITHDCPPGCPACVECASGEPVPPVARVEGRIGPAPAEQVKSWLGHDRVDVKPVLDLSSVRPVDAYEVPDWMGEALRLLFPGRVDPFSSATTTATETVDTDHSVPYARGPDGRPARPGQTRPDNLGRMGRFMHRVRTHDITDPDITCPGTGP